MSGIINYRGNALGNFAVALLNALETQYTPYGNPIGQVRKAVEAFKQREDEIIQQMCSTMSRKRIGAIETIFAHYTRDAEAPMQVGR